MLSVIELPLIKEATDGQWRRVKGAERIVIIYREGE